ncbi:flavin-dependent dehydrogenase [Leptolyngbya sp. FACHB-17]|uniref:NAD(P)/FAD-dependent oxidoreductase n=1 Tax=unclassified Leptolyngbya TaxID=2650499 RepID=UPI001680F9B4|nr:flavin-dependent dehydrogenase [Leptolyngbya sp. FACHB-17]MBD2079960.1 flavin-dependent dehydrogenase [Leptolyngbya sp. FACHB-17]
MKEILYLEVPTPDTNAVIQWLHTDYHPDRGEKTQTPAGIRLTLGGELSIFVWSLQRSTYLKVFRTGTIAHEKQIINHFVSAIRTQFPNLYPEPPNLDLSQHSIFEALAPYYPKTVEFFKKIPNGEYDLNRVYWWEQRWREGVRAPQAPKQVVFVTDDGNISPAKTAFDLVYVGGALGIVHAAVMARLGYRVLLLERMPFGRMNREWNISRGEFQSLIDLGLFTAAEFDRVIANEYVDGFHKFFDANNPPQAKAKILHTPTVLNVAIDAEKFLKLCGDKLREAGGEIWDETEFQRADISRNQVTIYATHLPTQSDRQITGRLLVDAMGTASPIAWQLNGGRAFDSVCPTVGAVISDGFDPAVWDSHYGDVLNSHGDISRGRQLIWELFPAEGKELTFYLFHYHQVHPENPGSLLEMYEDFFTILPEYRRCDMDKLVWKKATFGYIPGHFSTSSRDRTVAFDRLIAIGDAASLQSPLVFTGFGSLVRNLSRLTQLLDTALKHDLLTKQYLNAIRAYQSNISVTWMFSRGMMVPTGKSLPPQQVNSMLNTFFDVLATQPPAIADAFIKDRVTWTRFNRMAIVAGWKNPSLLLWIWQMAGAKDLLRWTRSYLSFGVNALISWILSGWFPKLLFQVQPWLEPRFPALWLWGLSQSYALTYGMGKPDLMPKFKLSRPRTAIGINPRSRLESREPEAGNRQVS